MHTKSPPVQPPFTGSRPKLRKNDAYSRAGYKDGNSDAAPFRSTVACLDNSRDAAHVFRHAIAVASGLDIPVKPAHVLQGWAAEFSPSDPIGWQIKMREAQDYLSRIVKPENRSFVLQDQLLLNGVAGEEISRWTSENADNLIAMTTRCGLENGHSANDLALGRTAQMVLDRTDASLLLIPPDGKKEKEDIVYRRLIVPLDGSWRAESVLPFAMRIARKHGAELLLAHVIPKPEIVAAGLDDAEANDFVMKLNQFNEKNARAYLDRLQSRLTSGGIVVRSVLEKEGDVRERLLGLADSHAADLIVMSARGKGTIHNMSCGNVARHIAGHTKCPLLLIRQQKARPTDHSTLPRQRYGPRLLWESAH
tara:strand:- start:4706 stop:5800 length:1095 start_codon:yes stop_codon:yes gene_type:complete